MFEKLVSILLVPLLFLQTMLPTFLGNRYDPATFDADRASLHSLSDYIEYVENNGAPSYSTAVFVKKLAPFSQLLRTLNGRPFAKEDEKYLNVKIDETLTEMCDYMAQESGLDLVLLLSSVPNLNYPAELLVNKLHFDPTQLRDAFYAMRDKAYADGQTYLGYLFYLLGVYYSVISEVDFYAQPYGENPDEIEVIMDIVLGDGERMETHPGIIINTQTGEVHGWTDKGLIDVGFDFNWKDVLIYGAVHAWQRALGFSAIYDLLANATPLFNMNTRRFHFDYNGKEWMIQIWKGNYGLVTNGVEVGVYNRPKGSVGTFYNAAGDDELMMMSASLYHGDTLLFTEGPEMHWWLSAFKLSKTIYQPKDLTMTFTIEMKDEAMLQAFTAAIDNHGAHDVTYTVDGLTVTAKY